MDRVKILTFLKVIQLRKIMPSHKMYMTEERRLNPFNPLSYIAIPMLYLISWEMPNWNMVKSEYFFKWK
jgi:hypothetical protein